MIASRRLLLAALLVPAFAQVLPAQVTAPAPTATPQSIPSRSATRPIRRDIPITNTIQRAFAAGTRDQTGRPGARYWQLWTDYRIRARLDSATSTVSGTETVSFRNNSDSVMRSIVLRLDQNIRSEERR